MANDDHIAQLKNGVTAWNTWRSENRNIRPDLSWANLSGANLSGADLSNADLSNAHLETADLFQANLTAANLSKAKLTRISGLQVNFSGANLSGVTLSEAFLIQANLAGANLSKTNLFRANLGEANLQDANLAWSSLMGARLSGADLRSATLRPAVLSFADLTGAHLSGVDLSGDDLERSLLIETDVKGASLDGCRVYGTSVWNVKTDQDTKQRNLIITPRNEPEVSVDNIEVTQFVYLLLNNAKIRDVIDTIGRKGVLILGRFTDERKTVLDALREELRNRNFLPILFDFAIPASRDVTETIKTLAGLALFVIADVTDATEVRVELYNIVPYFTSLPIQLILLRGHPEFVSLSHLMKFPWVLPIFEYDDREHLLASLDQSVVSPAEDAASKLRS